MTEAMAGTAARRLPQTSAKPASYAEGVLNGGAILS